jgi:anti-anti-sigma factor
VSTSLSASSLNDSSGARTPMASLVTGIIVVLTLLVLAPLFSDLPKPVLAAIIIDAVVFGMIDVAELRRLWRVKRVDFWIAVLAIVGVLSAGVLTGVVIGLVLSLCWLLYVSATPAITELRREPGTTAFRPVDDLPTGAEEPGQLVVRFEGGLTFVTAESFTDGIEQLLDDADPGTGVVIDFGGVNFIDSQGADQIDHLLELCRGDDRSLRLARVHGEVHAVLDAAGVLDRIGADHVHANLDEAVGAPPDRPSPG